MGIAGTECFCGQRPQQQRESIGPDDGYRKTEELSTETHRNFKPLFHFHKKNPKQTNATGYFDTGVAKENNSVSS